MNLGIICEFNPFHSGHKYLIDSVKKDGDAVICCMSGNFVQRADMAVYDKFSRCAVALKNGADIVIELPTLCVLQSAGGFAKSAVDLLESTGVCDALCFGSECGDIEALKSTAKKIRECDCAIKQAYDSGLSYAAARRKAVGDPILDGANNILALEYIAAADIECRTVKRIGGGHDSDDPDFSASEIRKGLDLSTVHSLKNCENAVLYKLRNMTKDDFLKIGDVGEGLENRIVSAVRSSSSLEEIYSKIKTKRYTHSRIRRIILRAYLGITEDMPSQSQYIRILGFSPRGRELMAQMKKKRLAAHYNKICRRLRNSKRTF